MLLEGTSEGGLYLIVLDKFSQNTCPASVALLDAKTSLDVWHARLGHPSSQVTKHILSSFKLLVVGL